eukprot:s616_g8.t1
MDSHGFYVGPLPSSCTHGGHPPLIKQNANNEFATTGTGVYPPAMDQALAELIFRDFLASSSCGGVERTMQRKGRGPATGAEEVGPATRGPVTGAEEVGPVTGDETEQGCHPVTGKASEGGRPVTGAKEDGDPVTGSAEGSHPVTGMVGLSVTGDPSGDRSVTGNLAVEGLVTGVPEERQPETGHEDPTASSGLRGMLRAHYKGRARPFHDGLGLCSMGRQTSKSRDSLKPGKLKELKRVFWDRLEGWLDALGSVGELKLVAQILCGKLDEQPFGRLPEEIREEWVARLRGARRRGSDRASAIEFRLLEAVAEAAEDPDYRYLGEMASTGVRLGTEGEIPRISAVYEEKTKWNLPDPEQGRWEDELVRDNYRSAQDHMEKVKEQIQKDLEKGDIIEVPLSVARARYGSTLKVASLAAVPKDPAWEQVRVVHDATHGVEVNHHIRLVNQMRFPLFDDLEAAMAQFLSEADCRKLVMAYDFKGAHRLIPVHEDDWGKQAFRLDASDRIFVNCVGTFGVASAAFWWSRLAGTLQRVMWRFLPYNHPLYALLYADDGLALTSGPHLRQGLIGISDKKVKWLEEWSEGVLSRKGVLGRDMKAALGRMGFLAGPLKHARPFLALVYRWTAKIGSGSFAELPMAVQLTLRFFLEAVRQAPRRVPRAVPRPGGEIFRVDAKADAGMVSIGGWESFSGCPPSHARWFSVRLTRQNAPWIYVKGEPFKIISSLELLAITVALMVFGPDAKWTDLAGRLALTAYTDNQTNSYVLDRFMSTAFPASVVLMELAIQLQERQLDLDLQWIPREQNIEADALTNEDFSMFTKERRLEVEVQNLDFKVLHVLMKLAEEIDQEIILKRSSKTQAAPQDPAKKMRVLGGFSRQDLESLGDFHKENFRDAEPGGQFPPFGPDGGNGLFSDVLASRLSLEQVESEVMELIERHCPLGECPLVGYSVQCDREVIKDKMPRLYRHLSHQIIDVSGFFTVARYWLPDRWQDWDRRSNTYNHRALNDAEDAIEAMRWVRQKFFSPDWAPQEFKQLSDMKF